MLSHQTNHRSIIEQLNQQAIIARAHILCLQAYVEEPEDNDEERMADVTNSWHALQIFAEHDYDVMSLSHEFLMMVRDKSTGSALLNHGHFLGWISNYTVDYFCTYAVFQRDCKVIYQALADVIAMDDHKPTISKEIVNNIDRAMTTGYALINWLYDHIMYVIDMRDDRN